MKYRYLLTSLVACLGLLGACTNELPGDLAELQVSKSYISIPAAGGETTTVVTSSDSWSFVGDNQEIPEWLVISPSSGKAGETTVSFSATESLDTRSANLKIFVGDKVQYINVKQQVGNGGVDISTCAEVIAGPDNKTYQVEGVCTSILNSVYGNWYLQDETGTIYIYGTRDAKGAEMNFASLGIEVGDRVLVEGPKTTYGSTIELVNAKVVKLTKSLIKVETDPLELPIEGGDFSIELTCKGDGVSVVIPDDAKSWLSVTGITTSGNTAKVDFTAVPNEGGDRIITLIFNTTYGGATYSAQTELTQKGAIKEVTVAEFNAAPKGTAYYRLKGVVSKVVSDEKGRFNIKDYTGETYIYGLYKDGVKITLTDAGIGEGDIVTIVGQRDEYKTTIEALNSYCEAKTDVTECSIAEILKKEDSKTDWFKVTGTVKEIVKDDYGNLYLTDGTNDLYVYGCVIGYGATGDAKKQFASLGVKVGDTLTMIGYKTSYKGNIQLGGGIYLSHETPVVATGIAISDANLPTAYAEAETTFDEGGYSYYIYKVANYGSGIQLQGKKTSYIANKTALPAIKTITVTTFEGKTWHKDNLVLYAGTAEKPEATAITISSDDATGSVYDLSAGNYTYFKLVNTSDYGVYCASISIATK